MVEQEPMFPRAVSRSFSVVITPPNRTKAAPYDLEDISEKMKQSVSEGNDTARWLLRVLEICFSVGVRFWLENPSLS